MNRLQNKYRGSENRARSDEPVRVNALHDYCVAYEAGADVDAFHSDVYYARSWLVSCTDFVRKHGVPTMQEVEQALITEFGTLSADDITDGDDEDLSLDYEIAKETIAWNDIREFNNRPDDPT